MSSQDITMKAIANELRELTGRPIVDITSTGTKYYGALYVILAMHGSL